MAVNRWMPKRPQEVDSSGNPYVGGGYYFFANESSTPQDTYTTSDGDVENSHPIVTGVDGRPATQIWLTEGLTYSCTFKNSAGVTIWTEDGITGIGDAALTLDQWIGYDVAPTYVSSSSFTVPGDQTSTFARGTAIKATVSGSSVFTKVVSSAFTSLTTVTVEGTSLTSGLSAVATGIITPSNNGLPAPLDTNPVAVGSSDITKKLRDEVDGISTGTTRVRTAVDYDVRVGNLPAGLGPLPYGGSTVPTGWLECTGAAVSRTTYAALYTAIGDTWGEGDGTTTFNLPDLRGRTPIGAGTGDVQETVTDAEITTGTDAITVASNTTKWITGMQVTWGVTGTPPTTSPGNLLDNNDVVYVVRIDATTIKLATTLANAQNGTVIDITNAGSGTFILTHSLTARTLGQYGGEESHAMSSTELLAHTHTVNNNTGAVDGGSAGGVQVINGTEASGSTGGNAAMNVMNPFAVVKYIISY